ncbi:MAG: HlyD family secretion protein [Paracoccaceae bacterium]
MGQLSRGVRSLAGVVAAIRPSIRPPIQTGAVPSADPSGDPGSDPGAARPDPVPEVLFADPAAPPAAVAEAEPVMAAAPHKAQDPAGAPFGLPDLEDADPQELAAAHSAAAAPAAPAPAVPALVPKPAGKVEGKVEGKKAAGKSPDRAAGKTAAADLPASSFFGDDDFDDIGPMPGGGMGGRMGGMGGMGGGRMGGMAGGMGGRMGGMGGGMGGAGAEPQGKKGQAQMALFNPTGLFRLLYILFYPFKYILWMIVPLVALAGMTMLQNLEALGEDTARLMADLSSVTQFVLGLFLVNLLSRLAQGTAIVAHGGTVPALGIKLVFNIMPRFFIDISKISEMDRRGQLWAYGSSLLSRLAIFSIFALVWAVSRDSGSWLPLVALVASQAALTVFLITAFPLMPADGLRFLSVLSNEPKIFGKALMAFKHVFLRGELTPMIEKKDALPLAFLALGMILTLTALIGLLGVVTAIWLNAELGGLGMVIFLGMVVAFVLYFMAMVGSMKNRAGGGRRGKAARMGGMMGGVGGMAEAAPDADAGFDREAFRQMAAGRADPAAEPATSSTARVVWALILLGLAILAFQPYDYEAGGQVEFLPAARGQSVARTDGEIIAILVQEGEIVQAGQLLAQLSSWDQQQQRDVTRTNLAAAEAEMKRLLEGASPEEIELAQRQLESAQASLAFSQAEADRAQTLAATGAGSQAAYEKALSTLQADLASLEVSQASLDLVTSPASATDIEILQAEIDRLRLEMAFAEAELDRTRILASMDGRIVTPNLHLLTGSFLRAGDPLVEIENARQISAVIAVPESDIGLIAPGDVVRLKAAGQSDLETAGTVQAIAPSAEDEGYGSVVRVTAVFPNQDEFLRSGMTGYAKIDGANMQAWQAYLRSIMRFFQIEVWSWIP